MEKLDSVFLDDIRNHMYFCTGLAVRFVSLVSDMGNVDNPECREILKELMCTLIMEGEAQRVLDFLRFRSSQLFRRQYRLHRFL